MSRREEFSSTIGESTINLGHFKNKDYGVATYDQKMLTHDRSVNTTQHSVVSQGLDQTRFHKGFNRRHQSQISNPAAGMAETDALHRSMRQEAIGQIRSESLKERDAKLGYNIITGSTRGNGPVPAKPEGIRKVGDGLGPEAPARGKSVLRESAGRYFAPFGTGNNHQHRQNVLYNEGLSVSKKCGVLEAKKGDLHSYGVEDQFSKSEYTKNSVKAQTGLHETRVPGRFTPRQIPNHPSGNAAIVEKWGTNIDLNNRTLKGHV